MPQASDADRARYTKLFPDIGAEHAINELERRGYFLTGDWRWVPPSDHKPTSEEQFMIGFLVREWDFGGLAR